ncbi:S24 family peptidase (plasmid) [Neobacillus sp. SCS-31]|uniref:S24 family peptidase n=1 Tax=Neobacillus oceani TaxID=3115292 RepID=UPI00390622CB
MQYIELIFNCKLVIFNSIKLIKEVMKLKCFALEVVGAAMEPVLREGDLIVVDPEVLPAANAKDLAVFCINGQYSVSRYTRFGGHLILLPDQGRVTVVRPNSVEIIGKVVGFLEVPDNKENHSAGNTMAFVG